MMNHSTDHARSADGVTSPPLHVALVGECMLELLGPAFGTLQQGFGGDTLNTAIYLARCGQAQGLQVHYATALGDDALSTAMLQRWAAEGLLLDLVRRLPGRLPGLYQIEVDPRGERSFHYWRDSAAAKAYFDTALTPLEAQADPWAVLYLSGISLAILPPAGRERLFALMQALRQRGATVVFDNNYRPRLWPDGDAARRCFARAFELASVSLLTLDDHQALLGLASAEAAQLAAMALPTPELVIKRGAAGTLVRAPGAPWQEAATETVARVVDTTAAGDSFAGAYLAARLAGANALAAARLGNRLAARVIQHPGAVIPLAEMAEVVELVGALP